MPPLFDLATETHEDVIWHVLTAGSEAVPNPVWPGLWEQQYPESPEMNPFWRFSVNNADGEALALWRALAWQVTEAPTRAAIPRYDRDHTARYLNLAPDEVPMIRWEYEVSYEVAPFSEANHGFQAACSSIPIRPEPSNQERENRHLAGLIPVTSLSEFHRIDTGVSFDVASEVSLFGVPHDFATLQSSLNLPALPRLADILGDEGVFAHLTIVRDRFPGLWSYLAIGAQHDLSDTLAALTANYEERWLTYLDSVPTLRSLADFAAAMDQLTSPASIPLTIVPLPTAG